MKRLMAAMRWSLVALYLVSAACWVIQSDNALVSSGRWILPGLVATHILEMAFYVPWFRKRGRPIAPEFRGLMTYGMFHFLDIKDEAK